MSSMHQKQSHIKEGKLKLIKRGKNKILIRLKRLLSRDLRKIKMIMKIKIHQLER